MIPHELVPRITRLPETSDHSIVLITGDEIRHQRFAYRIQKEFGDMVLAWYEVDNKPVIDNTSIITSRILDLYQKAKQRILTNYEHVGFKKLIMNEGIFSSARKALLLAQSTWNIVDTIRLQRKMARRQCHYEKLLFQEEIEELKLSAKLKPVKVQAPNSAEFIETIRKLTPYFLLSLGGDIYGKELLESIHGVCINQHAGWSPQYKGSGTTLWALYNRNLDYIGSTVHITTTGLDAGAIIRRSHPCLVAGDTPESCFARVVALGTELMIEVVKDIISDKNVVYYEQPSNSGKTFLGSQLDRHILKSIYKDFSGNWLEKELSRLEMF